MIGNFDGVHLGHQHVVREARAAADAEGLRVVAVTFDPHPMAVLRPEHAPTTITDIETRAELLRTAGVDDVLALPFDRDVASWTPQEFAQRVLADALHAAVVVVVGANFRYGVAGLGRRRHADRQRGGARVPRGRRTSRRRAAGLVFDVRPHLPGGRRRGRRGRGARAAVRGPRRRRARGPAGHERSASRPRTCPPASMAAAPADGVYAGWLRRLDTGERYPAAISVGTNPTFDGERERRVESYVLDRDDLELYDVEVEVSFVDRIRGMVRFDGVDALIETMHDDVRRAHEILGRPRPVTERRPIVDLTDAEARRALVLKWGTVPDDVIPAWVAEMDYALDPVVHEAVLQAVRDGVTGYPVYGYTPELAEAYAAFADASLRVGGRTGVGAARSWT